MMTFYKKRKKYVFLSLALMGILFAAKFIFQCLVTYELNRQVNTALVNLDPGSSFSANSINFHIFKPGIGLYGVKLHRDNRLALEVESTEVVLGSWVDIISIIQTPDVRLSKVSISVEGLEIDFENLDEKGQIVGRSLGLFNLHGSLYLEADVDSRNGLFNLDSLKIDLKELFNLNLALQMRGLDFKSTDKLMDALEVTGIRADYFDMSMMGRAMNLETFPEFVNLKNSMVSSKDIKQQDVDYLTRVTLSEETNKKVTQLFTQYLLKPNTLTIFQGANKSIRIKNFNEIYLARQKDLSEFLGELGLKIQIESEVYF